MTTEISGRITWKETGMMLLSSSTSSVNPGKLASDQFSGFDHETSPPNPVQILVSAIRTAGNKIAKKNNLQDKKGKFFKNIPQNKEQNQRSQYNKAGGGDKKIPFEYEGD